MIDPNSGSLRYFQVQYLRVKDHPSDPTAWGSLGPDYYELSSAVNAFKKARRSPGTYRLVIFTYAIMDYAIVEDHKAKKMEEPIRTLAGFSISND